MLNISIQTIPSHKQRYDTVGDWWWEQDTLQIRVSARGNWRAEACVALHEAIEALLCRNSGVTTELVDAWDFENPDKEPGDQPQAPYQHEHSIASAVERLLCAELRLPWRVYEKILGEK